MQIAGITREGLAVTALSVAVLWACVIGQSVLIHRAQNDQARALHEIHLLQRRQRAEPASAPTPRFPHIPRETAG